MANSNSNNTNGHLPDETRWDHKWGFRDTQFKVNRDRSVTVTGQRYLISGTEMPTFIPFVEEMLAVTIDEENLKLEQNPKHVPPPKKHEAFCQDIIQTFPHTQYTFAERQRLIHSHGQTTAEEVYKVLYGRLPRVADMVFYPESEGDALQLVQLAQTHNICLVPYGGGTSVSGALKLLPQETRMIVSVDMRRLNKIEWIDRDNFRACVQAGITGQQLEESLAQHGFTCGHEPDSIELSTLGGWIATNASGMKKNRYGNIEDIVENVTMITPQGILEQATTMPRLSMGMQPQQLLFGSEGNLGLITKAIIRIHKLPEVKRYGSIVFPDFKTGTDFLYELAQTGVLPASVRLVDNVQFRFGSALKARPTTTEMIIDKAQKYFLFQIKKLDPHQIAAATVVMEGTAAEVKYQEKLIYKIAKKHQGIPGGEGNGKRGYMLTYAIAYIRDFLSDFHIIGETYETTVPWSHIHRVINAVADKVIEQHQAFSLPGQPYISPRITQLYHTGVCIYFTHGFSTKGVANPDEIFSTIEHALRQTIIEAGGSISHHHGVGKIRKDFMVDTLSPTEIQLLHQVKQTNDPQNIFGIGNNIFAP